MSAREKQKLLAEDASDLYHRRLKLVLVPVLGAYALNALFARSSAARVRGEVGEWLSISGDSGLRMALRAPFPPLLLAAHSVGAVVLMALTLFQKEVVRAMARDLAGYVALHRRIGYAALAALAVMDAAGYAAGSAYSAFPGFSTFAKGFALPFAIWLVGIWATAWAGWLRSHALLGNMLVKGCIATPLSRIGGACLQRMGWPMAAGYYQGIGAVACVIGVWQAADCLAFARKELERRRRR